MSFTAVIDAPCGQPPIFPLCIPQIGGGEACFPTDAPGLRDAIRALREVNAMLNPYVPNIIVVNAVAAIGKFIENLPENVVLAPTDAGEALGNSAATVAVALAAVGQLNVPEIAFAQMVIGIVKAVRNALQALKRRIQLYIAKYARLATKLTTATQINNQAMIIRLGCAKANADAGMARVAGEFAAIGSVIAILNVLLCLLNQAALGPLPVVTGELDILLTPIDLMVEVLNDLLGILPNVPGMALTVIC